MHISTKSFLKRSNVLLMFKYNSWNICCFILLFLPFLAFSQTACYNLPKNFKSYNQAVFEVKNAKFKFVDHVNTTRSSFIRGARYYSCDGEFGFLVIEINDRQYIHSRLPKKVWLSFKSAKSFGTFYNQAIRNRYRLNLK